MRLLIVCLLATAARAEEVPLDGAYTLTIGGTRITLGDLPGTGGNWQDGVADIAAPPARVREWLTDYAAWPERFPDIVWAQVLPDDAAGRHVIRFRSRIADTTLTVHEAVLPNLLVFEGSAVFLHTQGRIHLVDLGDGRTRVHMQSTAEAHGLARLVASQRYKRAKAHQVATAHLVALVNQARAWSLLAR